jgi:CRP-like cAMP-binding protein
MDVQKAEILKGLSTDCATAIMDIAVQESHGEGTRLFLRGDPAGQTGKVVHHVTRPGEIIGWSGLVGREVYSASAECTTATEFHKIETGKLREIIEKNPVDGFVFFENLSRILGDRLLRSYSQYDKVFVTSNLI